MSLKTNIEMAQCFVLSTTFAASVTYAAGKASVALADLLVYTGTNLPVEVLTVAGAPLAAIMASTSLTSMARNSIAPAHKKVATVFGGMAVVLPMIYVTVVEDAFISYNNPPLNNAVFDQQMAIPEPPMGGVQLISP